METTTDKILRLIEKDARGKVARFSKEIVRAPSQKKEEILAGMQIETWLADSCQESLIEKII